MRLDRLPIDILLHHVLPCLHGVDLAPLSATCQLFYRLCNDEWIWQHRVTTDFALPMDTDRLKRGWKRLYLQLDRAHVYTWGENSDKRLGFNDQDHVERDTFMRHITTPRELRALRGQGVVAMVAGVGSFHALDHRGRVWMWGYMQPRHPFNDGGALVRKPARVMLPADVHIVSIASGRSHAIGLDSAGHVWHWANRWQPTRVHVPNARSQTFVQITAHCNFSAMLSAAGELFLVPFPTPHAIVLNDPPVSHPSTWVQMAGTEKCIIALARSGRVFKLWIDRRETFVAAPEDHTTELVHFAVQPDTRVRLSAQFSRFALCCQGKVLLGNQDCADDHEPQVIQVPGHDICKVAFGEYHFGALTTQGRLWTWGHFSSGALGRGYDHPNSSQRVPQLVEALNDMFVFAVGFGGTHSGCVAIPRQSLLQH